MDNTNQIHIEECILHISDPFYTSTTTITQLDSMNENNQLVNSIEKKDKYLEDINNNNNSTNLFSSIYYNNINNISQQQQQQQPQQMNHLFSRNNSLRGFSILLSTIPSFDIDIENQNLNSEKTVLDLASLIEREQENYNARIAQNQDNLNSSSNINNQQAHNSQEAGQALSTLSPVIYTLQPVAQQNNQNINGQFANVITLASAPTSGSLIPLESQIIKTSPSQHNIIAFTTETPPPLPITTSSSAKTTVTKKIFTKRLSNASSAASGYSSSAGVSIPNHPPVPIKKEPVKRGRKPNSANVVNLNSEKTKLIRQQLHLTDSNSQDTSDEQDKKTVFFGNKQVVKNTDEYVNRREKNNEAVKKCREKLNQQQKEREERLKILEDENNKLKNKNDTLMKELNVLKNLLIQSSPAKRLPEHIEKLLASLEQ